jgi:tetratricopeptide (TPR) repeat protein
MSVRAVVFAGALALVAAPPAPASAAVARDHGDTQEVEIMRRMNPHVVELLDRGEALAASGSLEAAHQTFAQGLKEEPAFGLLQRRDCEALTTLGRREQAVYACGQAMVGKRSNVNARALVRALVAGPRRPSVADLSQALTLYVLKRREEGSPIASAEMICSIAESLGDVPMLKQCLGMLESTVPNDAETRRAESLLASRCPPLRFWTGWLAILGAGVLTLLHALRGFAAERRRPLRAAVAAATGAVGLLLHANLAAALEPGMLSKWPVDDQHPEQNIPTEQQRNAEPLQFGYWLQDVALKAEKAVRTGNHEAAIRYYAALAVAVPDRAIAFTKLCTEYEAVADLEKAINACGQALQLDGVKVGDFTHFVHLVLAKPGQLGKKERLALATVLQHMRDDPQGRGVVDDLECEVGVRTSNVAQLKECTTGLAAKAPDDAKTIVYEWSLAVQEGRFVEAEKLIDRARSKGIRVDQMAAATAGHKRQHLIVLIGVAGLTALFAAAVLWGRNAVRRRLAPGAA